MSTTWRSRGFHLAPSHPRPLVRALDRSDSSKCPQIEAGVRSGRRLESEAMAADMVVAEPVGQGEIMLPVTPQDQ